MKKRYTDNSKLAVLNSCPAKYYWQYDRNLVLKDVVALPLEFGSAWHLAMEHLYLGDSLDFACDVFQTVFDPFSDLETKYNTAKGIDILKKYHKKYFPEYFDVLHVEKGVTVKIHNMLTFFGRIDLVFEMNGIIYIMDHKTTSNLGGYVVNPNHQFTGYIYAARKQFDLDVTGAMINLVQTYKMELRKKKNGAINDGFLRKPTSRNEVDFEDWKAWLLDCNERLNKYTRTGYWPKHTTGCYNFGKNCPYKDLCTCPHESYRERIIESQYEIKVWEPWNE